MVRNYLAALAASSLFLIGCEYNPTRIPDHRRIKSDEVLRIEYPISTNEGNHKTIVEFESPLARQFVQDALTYLALYEETTPLNVMSKDFLPIATVMNTDITNDIDGIYYSNEEALDARNKAINLLRQKGLESVPEEYRLPPKPRSTE